MKTKVDIQASLYQLKDSLKRDYGVKEIGLFGSYVRGDHQPGSDVDILVEFDAPVGLMEFVGLRDYLSEVLGLPVDLVMKRALRPEIGRRILQEVIYV